MNMKNDGEGGGGGGGFVFFVLKRLVVCGINGIILEALFVSFVRKRRRFSVSFAGERKERERDTQR